MIILQNNKYLLIRVLMICRHKWERLIPKLYCLNGLWKPLKKLIAIWLIKIVKYNQKVKKNLKEIKFWILIIAIN